MRKADISIVGPNQSQQIMTEHARAVNGMTERHEKLTLAQACK